MPKHSTVPLGTEDAHSRKGTRPDSNGPSRLQIKTSQVLRRKASCFSYRINYIRLRGLLDDDESFSSAAASAGTPGITLVAIMLVNGVDDAPVTAVVGIAFAIMLDGDDDDDSDDRWIMWGINTSKPRKAAALCFQPVLLKLPCDDASPSSIGVYFKRFKVSMSGRQPSRSPARPAAKPPVRRRRTRPSVRPADRDRASVSRHVRSIQP